MASFESVTDAFASFDRQKKGCVETSDLAALCSSLGEPLSHSELEEAVAVLDPDDSGRIMQAAFMKWWEDAIGGAAMSPRSRNIASPQSGRYADDAGSTAGSQPGGPKLTVVRHLRKQAQNDAQLLINRIALLRQEEAKARKKIQETQLRAQEMLALKKHTVEKLAVKQQREAAAKKKQELVRQRVEKQKRAHAKKMELARKRVAEAKVQEVREVHIMRRKFKAEREQQKREKVAKARKKHEAVKGRDGAVQRAQEAQRRERQARVIEEYERKIEEENARRAAKEAEVRRMEKEELKLIEALKKVQVLQREAFEELEAALAGENGGPPPRGRQRKSSIKSSARSSSARSTSKRRTGKKRGTKRGSKGSRGSQRSQRPAA